MPPAWLAASTACAKSAPAASMQASTAVTVSPAPETSRTSFVFVRAGRCARLPSARSYKSVPLAPFVRTMEEENFCERARTPPARRARFAPRMADASGRLSFIARTARKGSPVFAVEPGDVFAVRGHTRLLCRRAFRVYDECGADPGGAGNAADGLRLRLGF